MVITFDLSSTIPEGTAIKNAILAIFFTSGTIGDKYSTAYRLTKEWDESAVSWMNAAANVSWLTPGGEYSEENVSRTDYVPDSSWEHYEVTAIVQKFANGIANYGFVIESDPTNGNKRRCYYSSEFAVLDSLRPKLTITYISNAIINSTQYKNLLEGILLRNSGSGIRLFVPFEKQYRISLFNARGEIIEAVYGYKSQWCQLKAALPSNGVYFMQIYMDSKTVTWKVTLLK